MTPRTMNWPAFWRGFRHLLTIRPLRQFIISLWRKKK